MEILKSFFSLVLLLLAWQFTMAQEFYLGADLSYVNEMEDCGAIYIEDGDAKDVYGIFADHECNLVRLRLWHTPSWYDNLNDGKRYCDLADVKRSIARARAEGMDVLLNFHLSDNWADPSKQVVPAAWADVVDNLPVLKDSLYNYIFSVLMDLHHEGLLPEMVQIGNETNRGILLSQEVNDAGWTLDWDRNSQLFNRAIDAVRNVEESTSQNITVALHAAGPEDALWIYDAFIDNGVTDFDVMGISYYWAWHQPTTIPQTGEIIQELLDGHPGYQVMIFETGYIWTTQNIDDANNIINSVQSGYAPASPEAQRNWLIDLTQEVINSGGKGVIYWEPAWVSTGCWTQWGRGSHQEHATFFDFDHNLMEEGGVQFLSHSYDNLTAVPVPDLDIDVHITVDSNDLLTLTFNELPPVRNMMLRVTAMNGQQIHGSHLEMPGQTYLTRQVQLPDVPAGVYLVSLATDDGRTFVHKIRL